MKSLKSLWHPLQGHIEVSDQELNVVPLFGLEGLRDEPRSLLMLQPPQGHAVHLQDHLTHFQLPAVVSRAALLWLIRAARQVFRTKQGKRDRIGEREWNKRETGWENMKRRKNINITALGRLIAIILAFIGVCK